MSSSEFTIVTTGTADVVVDEDCAAADPVRKTRPRLAAAANDGVSITVNSDRNDFKAVVQRTDALDVFQVAWPSKAFYIKSLDPCSTPVTVIGTSMER